MRTHIIQIHVCNYVGTLSYQKSWAPSKLITLKIISQLN